MLAGMGPFRCPLTSEYWEHVSTRHNGKISAGNSE